MGSILCFDETFGLLKKKIALFGEAKVLPWGNIIEEERRNGKGEKKQKKRKEKEQKYEKGKARWDELLPLFSGASYEV